MHDGQKLIRGSARPCRNVLDGPGHERISRVSQRVHGADPGEQRPIVDEPAGAHLHECAGADLTDGNSWPYPRPRTAHCRIGSSPRRHRVKATPRPGARIGTRRSQCRQLGMRGRGRVNLAAWCLRSAAACGPANAMHLVQLEGRRGRGGMAMAVRFARCWRRDDGQTPGARAGGSGPQAGRSGRHAPSWPLRASASALRGSRALARQP